MGQVMDSRASAGLAGATVLLKQDTVVVAGTAADRDGNFALPPVPLGIYLLETRFIGYGTKTMRYVATVNNPAPLRVLVPGFSPYADRGKPACVGGHIRHLLPIACGLPSASTMARARRGKVYLGGCDPRYYCPLHKRKL
jgi:hypothetical protein